MPLPRVKPKGASPAQINPEFVIAIRVLFAFTASSHAASADFYQSFLPAARRCLLALGEEVEKIINR